jgi:hypothetical protein
MSEEDRTALVRLQTQVENWMATTNDYRISLCEKITKITDKLDSLPCRERGEMYKGMTLTNKLMWSALGITFGIVIAHLGWK